MARHNFMMVAAAVALSAGSARAQLVGTDYQNGNLLLISTADASATVIGSTGVTSLGALDLADDGYLYGFTPGSGATLYQIDPATAATVAIGPLNVGFVFEGSLAIAPDGTAFATNQNSANSPRLMTVDLSTGQATVVGLISGGAHDISGMVVRSDGLLVGLDRVTNALLEIDPNTFQATLIAPVDPAIVGAIGAMTADGDAGWFSTAGPDFTSPGSNELWEFDLFTGATFFVGTFSAPVESQALGGLAFLGGELVLSLDIKPGSCPNSFNRNSNGVLLVGLLGTDSFDVADVDISTIEISRADGVGGSAAPNEGPPGPHTVVSDVGTPFYGELCDCHELEGDGVDDLSLKFWTQDLVDALELHALEPGSLVELVVSGLLMDGTPFEASDCIRLVPAGPSLGMVTDTTVRWDASTARTPTWR